MEYDRPPITFREQFPDRADIEYQQEREENSSFLGMAEKLAIIGIGTKILSRNVLKIDLAGYAAHYLGKFYQDSYSAVASTGRAIRRNPITGKPAKAASYTNIRGEIGARPDWDLNIAEHINNSIDILTAPNLAASVKLREEAIKEAFERKYAQAIPHHFDTSLERLSVANVLNKPKEFIEQFGLNSFEAIKKGKERGLLKDDYVVDNFIFRNKTSGQVLDTRLRSGKHLAKLFFNNINPLGVFKPVQDLLEDPGVAIVPTGTKINRDITIKGRDNIFAFGKIYNLDEAKPGVIKTIGSGEIRAFRAGGSLQETVAIHTGQAKIKEPRSKGLFNFLQRKVGIGPAYANRHSIPGILSRMFTAPLKQSKGEAVVKIKPFRSSSGIDKSEADAILGTLTGVVENSATRGGSVALPQKFNNISDYWNKRYVQKRSERWRNKLDYLKAKLGYESQHFELYKAKNVVPDFDVATKKGSLGLPTKEDLVYQRSIGPIESIDRPLPKNPNVKYDDKSAINAFQGLTEQDVLALSKKDLEKLKPSEKAFAENVLSYRATTAGGATPNQYSKYGFATKSTLTASAPNFLALRLNALIGTTFGIGIRPTASFTKNMMRVAAIPFGFQTALTAADYTDYLSEKFTGFSPIKSAAGLYTYAREKQQELREKTGLLSLFEKTEKIAPGLLESGLGYILRHGIIAASSIGLTLSGRRKLGFLAGLLGHTAIGGANIGQTPQDIKDEYAGRKLIEVRKSRFWGFGRQPFEGGRVDYMAPSWYQRLLKRPYMTNIYGGRDAYYAKHANVFGVPFPTLESAFGLRQLLDPYRLEKETYYDRPYPVTGGMFKEVPVFGGLLDLTLGRILKPPKRMHGEFYENQTLGVHTNLYSQHLPNQIGEKLGYGKLGAAGIDVTQGYSIYSKFQDIINQATEPLGFYKFIAEKVLGILPDQSTFKEADSSSIGSASRSFYDLQLGGAGGLTELLRRFFLPEWGAPNKLNERVNPIPNTMPDWLPGSRSQFMRDKFPWVDFHAGDPFTKLPGGEWRLPGRGYEEMFGLHSGQPGVYDEVDRFLVLNSIAPFSEGYLYYKIRALSRYNKGELDPYWAGRIEQAIEFEKEKKERFDYYPRLFTKDAGSRGNILDFKRDLGEINEQTKFSGPERILRAGWEILSHDVLQHIPYVGTKLAPFYSPIEHYKKFQIYGSESAMWDNPWADIIRPGIYETAAAPAPMPFLKGAMIGAALGHPASPLRAFNPFPQGSALNNSSLISKFGIAGSALGWGKMLLTQNISGDFIPPHVLKQRQTEEYFDKMRYIKARMIEERAMSSGDQETAEVYRREAASTFTGLTSSSTKSYMRRALSRIDRAYFDAFSNAPTSDRASILSAVPDYVKPIYQKIWGIDSSLNSRSQEDADQEALEYLNTHILPNKNSIVWHPDVPMQAVKSAFLDSGINGVADSFSKFDIYPRAIEETRLSFPGLYDMTPQRINNSFFGNMANAISSFMNPFDNMKWTIGGNNTSTANMNIIDSDSRNQKYMYMQQAMIYG